MHRIIKGAIIAATSLAAIGAGSAAHASATVNSAGQGFVGKGDVQTALGYNNAQMQANATGLKFTTSQDATQVVTQDVKQSATQTATQSAVQYGVELGKQSAEQEMIETLSCTKTNGDIDQRVRIGTRDGERTAERIGTRDGERTAERIGTAMGTRTGTATGTAIGTRTGTQAGDLTGKLSATVAYDARQRNQITGFNLTGFAIGGEPKFVAEGEAVYGDPNFGDYDFGDYVFGQYQFAAYEFAPYVWFGDFNFGATTWETTDFTSTDQNGDPDGVCKEGANNVVPGSVTLVLTEGKITIDPDHEILATLNGNIVDGAITDGVITDGVITDGDVTYGDVTSSGAVKVFVNNKAL
jgi:hypothetical protein